MRILHVISSLRNGGAENQLLKIIKNNNQPNVNFYLFLLVYEVNIPIEGLPKNVFILKSFKRFWPLNIFLLIYSIWKIHPNLISSWMYLSCIVVSLLKVFKLYNNKIVWNIRNTELLAKGVSKATFISAHLLKKISQKKCDAIIYNSYASQRYHMRFGYNNTKSYVVGNCFEFAKLPSIQTRPKIIGKEFFVGSLGRFNEYKDYNTFISAATSVALSNPKVHFLLGGYGIDTQNNELSDIIKNAGLPSDRYSLIGPVFNKRIFFEKLNLFVLHSKSESFPNVLLEAIAYRTFSITTNVGDAEKLIGDKTDVFIPGSPETMAEKILKCASLNADEVTKKIKANFKLVVKDYNIKNIVDHYEQIISSISD